MPRGVYDRKPRPEACEQTVQSLHPVLGPDPMWDAFERCKGELAVLYPAKRRAVLGALAGWFNDGKYD